MASSNEYIEFKLQQGLLNKALQNIEYKRVHDFFGEAIEASLQIIKKEAQSQLRSKMPSMAKYADTISSEVRNDAMAGRVKIIKDKQPMYQCKDVPYWKLRFFENDIKDRETKKYKGDRKKGHSTGSIQGTHFFSTAKEASMQIAAEELRRILLERIGNSFNEQ